MNAPVGHDEEVTPCTGLPHLRADDDREDTPRTELPPVGQPRPNAGVRELPEAPPIATATPAGATAALVCGILSLVLWGMPVVGLVLGILAIVLGARARAAQRRDPALYLPSGAATAGLVCGIIGTALSTLTTALFAFILFMISLIASLVGMAGGHHGPPPPSGPIL